MDGLFRESLERPNDAELRYEIGAILFQYGSPDDAARWMRAALELQPDHPGASGPGHVQRSTGRRGGASVPRERANADQRQP